MLPIRHIYSENPYQKMWDTFVYFESEPTTKNFLSEIYQRKYGDDSFKYAFQNTSKFIYFIKQAKEYFNSAENSNILVKPLLIYYGMMSLIKAVILTHDPTYPSRTSVLRHGITTRKLKKSNFQFHDDEVKIQKEGLIPLFFTIIEKRPIDKIEGNKYKIKELLSLLPELNESYTRIFKDQTIFPLTLSSSEEDNLEIKIPKTILKKYSGSEQSLLHNLNGYLDNKENKFLIMKNQEDKSFLKLRWTGSIKSPFHHSNFFTNPLIIQDIKGRYFLRPFNDSKLLLPEIMIDYMLMYNLGMLCRYETELWGEIIFSFTSEDMYIITEFVNSTIRKFPNLILNNLFQEFLIFEGN